MVKHVTLAAAAAALVLLGGCSRKNEVSVEAYALCTMPDDCTFAATCAAQYIGTPRIDVTGAAASGDAMWLAVEMHNQLADNADPEAGRSNTHDATFESYSLSFSGPRPSAMPATITDVSSGTGHVSQVIPAGGTAVIGFEPVPFSLIQTLAASTTPAGPNYDEVTVTVTFKGKIKDGTKWEAALDVPVRICHDCVFPVCSDATQLPVSACPSLHQVPAGAPSCTKPTPTCLAIGTFCGSNPNVLNGDVSTLYSCTAAGVAPANSSACAKGCDATVSPNACNP